jgi:hypothetical protein
MDVNRVFLVKEFSWIVVGSMVSPTHARRVLAGIGNRYPLCVSVALKTQLVSALILCLLRQNLCHRI